MAPMGKKKKKKTASNGRHAMDEQLTRSSDPKLVAARIYVGNLVTEKAERTEISSWFEPYGKVLAISVRRGYAFVQFGSVYEARKACENLKGFKFSGVPLVVKLAAEGRAGWQTLDSTDKDNRNQQARSTSGGPPSNMHRATLNVFQMPPAEESEPANFPRDADNRRAAPNQNYRAPNSDYYPNTNTGGGYNNRGENRNYNAGGYDTSYQQGEGYQDEGADYNSQQSDMQQERHYNRDASWNSSRRYDPQPTAATAASNRYRYESDDYYNQRSERSAQPRPAAATTHSQSRGHSQSRDRRDAASSSAAQRDTADSGKSAAASGSAAGGNRSGTYERPYDCTIVVTHKENRSYAELVERRLVELNLSVDIVYLITPKDKILGSEESESISRRVVESLARRGILFAAIIEKPNVQYKSVTVVKLLGVPEEHRNMPLDDALAMLASDMGKYLNRLRSGTDQPSLSFLLHLLADGRHLSDAELGRIAQYLADRVATAGAAPSERRQVPPAAAQPVQQQLPPAAAQTVPPDVQRQLQMTQQQQRVAAVPVSQQQQYQQPVSVASVQQQLRPAASVAVSSVAQTGTGGYMGGVQSSAAPATDQAQNDAAQLQAKILSLLNKNTSVGMPAKPSDTPPVNAAVSQQQQQTPLQSGMLNSPEAVSKALQNLLSSSAFKGAASKVSAAAAAVVSTAPASVAAATRPADADSSATAAKISRLDMDPMAWFSQLQGKMPGSSGAAPPAASVAQPPSAAAPAASAAQQMPPQQQYYGGGGGAQPQHQPNYMLQQHQQHAYAGMMANMYGQPAAHQGYYAPQPTAAMQQSGYGAYGPPPGNPPPRQ